MNHFRKEKLLNALEQILNVLVTRYQPEKIILFGSLVSEDVGDWSDIDLVIIKNTPLPFLQRLKEVALLCDAPVGVDYLVYTPAEFEQMIAEENPFIMQDVLQKGEVLYEWQPAAAMAR
jgi:uncharacterized protein